MRQTRATPSPCPTPTLSSGPTLNTEGASHYTGIAVSTLKQWRCHGTGPAFIKAGRAVRYLRSDLDAFLAERRHTSTVTAPLSQRAGR